MSVDVRHYRTPSMIDGIFSDYWKLGRGATVGTDFNDDPHLDVCQNIEFGLKREYENNEKLTDAMCIFGLEAAKIAIRKQCGFAKNEKVPQHPLTSGIIEWCTTVGLERIGKVNNLTLNEFVARIEKVRRSVIRHSDAGPRGYYEFIRDFV